MTHLRISSTNLRSALCLAPGPEVQVTPLHCLPEVSSPQPRENVSALFLLTMWYALQKLSWILASLLLLRAERQEVMAQVPGPLLLTWETLQAFGE